MDRWRVIYQHRMKIKNPIEAITLNVSLTAYKRVCIYNALL